MASTRNNRFRLVGVMLVCSARCTQKVKYNRPGGRSLCRTTLGSRRFAGVSAEPGTVRQAGGNRNCTVFPERLGPGPAGGKTLLTGGFYRKKIKAAAGVGSCPTAA